MSDYLEWEPSRPNRLVNHWILFFRRKITDIIQEEDNGNIYDVSGISFRQTLSDYAQREKPQQMHNRMELKHFQRLLEKQLTKKQFKQIRNHPLIHYRLQKVLFPYHAWVRFREILAWKEEYNSSFSRDPKQMSILNRIHLLPDKHRRAFLRIYSLGTYLDDAASILVFAKNVITHINDHLRDAAPDVVRRDWTTMEQVEELLSSTFPELGLQIFTFCLIKDIDMDEFFSYRVLKELGEATSRGGAGGRGGGGGGSGGIGRGGGGGGDVWETVHGSEAKQSLPASSSPSLYSTNQFDLIGEDDGNEGGRDNQGGVRGGEVRGGGRGGERGQVRAGGRGNQGGGKRGGRGGEARGGGSSVGIRANMVRQPVSGGGGGSSAGGGGAGGGGRNGGGGSSSGIWGNMERQPVSGGGRDGSGGSGGGRGGGSSVGIRANMVRQPVSGGGGGSSASGGGAGGSGRNGGGGSSSGIWGNMERQPVSGGGRDGSGGSGGGTGSGGSSGVTWSNIVRGPVSGVGGDGRGCSGEEDWTQVTSKRKPRK